jgi:hypothetical protein
VKQKQTNFPHKTPTSHTKHHLPTIKVIFFFTVTKHIIKSINKQETQKHPTTLSYMSYKPKNTSYFIKTQKRFHIQKHFHIFHTNPKNTFIHVLKTQKHFIFHINPKALSYFILVTEKKNNNIKGNKQQNPKPNYNNNSSSSSKSIICKNQLQQQQQQ